MRRLNQRDSIAAVIAAVVVTMVIHWSNARTVSAADGKSTSISETASTAKSDDWMKASVKDCHDGDTCRVVTETGHMWMNVRLAGIDAPERANRHNKSKGQPMGDAARKFVNDQVAGKTVDLEQVDLDAYNRPVVVIWNGPKNVNMTMVEEGMAEAYRGPVKRIDQDAYFKAEARAKAAAKGIWRLPASERQSPAEYRKQVRANRKY